MFRPPILFLFILIFCWGSARFSHHQTKGFRLSKIQKNTSCIPFEHQSPPLSLLDQKFSYFGRGLQSFSFLSEDGTTVLKLFNNRYQNRLFWLHMVPSIGPLKRWKQKEIHYNMNKWAQAFESYALAYTALKEEAGLLFFHPHSCTQCPCVTLVDPLRIEHRLDLSRHAFVLQKKALLPYPYLDACCKQGDVEEGRQAIHSLVNLLKKKMELGIADRDPLIRANLGFYRGEAIQIDIGPLHLDPTVKDSAWQKGEIQKTTLPLKHWLETHHEELLPYLNEALQNL